PRAPEQIPQLAHSSTCLNEVDSARVFYPLFFHTNAQDTSDKARGLTPFRTASQFHIMPIMSAHRTLGSAFRTQSYVLTSTCNLAYVKTAHFVSPIANTHHRGCGGPDDIKPRHAPVRPLW